MRRAEYSKLGFFLFFSILGVSSFSNANAFDCPNAKIEQIISNLGMQSVIVFSSTSCVLPNDGHVCLSTDPNLKTVVERMYSQILSAKMANKTLTRISMDTAQIVSGCGYPVLSEVRY